MHKICEPSSDCICSKGLPSTHIDTSRITLKFMGLNRGRMSRCEAFSNGIYQTSPQHTPIWLLEYSDGLWRAFRYSSIRFWLEAGLGSRLLTTFMCWRLFPLFRLGGSGCCYSARKGGDSNHLQYRFNLFQTLSSGLGIGRWIRPYGVLLLSSSVLIIYTIP